MSEGEFIRVSAIVEVIKGKSYLLPNEEIEAILGWVNSGNNEEFDQFCLAVADEWSDCYPQITTDDYEGIAKIIYNTLKGGF
jgi:hypothetical protein